MIYGVFSDPVAYVRGSICFPNKTNMNIVYILSVSRGFRLIYISRNQKGTEIYTSIITDKRVENDVWCVL